MLPPWSFWSSFDALRTLSMGTCSGVKPERPSEPKAFFLGFPPTSRWVGYLGPSRINIGAWAILSESCTRRNSVVSTAGGTLILHGISTNRGMARIQSESQAGL